MKISNIKFAAIFFGIILLSSISSVFPPTYANWEGDDGYPLDVRAVFESVDFKRVDWVWGYYDGMKITAATGECGQKKNIVFGKYWHQKCELPEGRFKLLSTIEYKNHKIQTSAAKTLIFKYQPIGTMDIIWSKPVPLGAPSVMHTLVYDVQQPIKTIFGKTVFEVDNLPHYGDCSPLDRLSIRWTLKEFEIPSEDHKFYYYSDIGATVILGFLTSATGEIIAAKVAEKLLKGTLGLEILKKFKASVLYDTIKKNPMTAAMMKDSSKLLVTGVLDKVVNPGTATPKGTPESEVYWDIATAEIYKDPKNWAGHGKITPVDHPQEGIIRYDENGTGKTELRFKELRTIAQIENNFWINWGGYPECRKNPRDCAVPSVGKLGFLNLKGTDSFLINNKPATDITYSLDIVGTDKLCFSQSLDNLDALDKSRPVRTDKDLVEEVSPRQQPMATRINAPETGSPISVDIDNKPSITDQGAMLIDLSEKSTLVLISADQQEFEKYSDYRFDFTDYLGNSIIKNGKENTEAMNNIHKYGTFEIKGTAVPNNSPTKEPVEIYHMAFFNSNLIKDQSGFLDDDPFLDDEPILAMIPSWVKDTASDWADGQVPDKDFLFGIGYMVEEGIIQVSALLLWKACLQVL